MKEEIWKDIPGYEGYYQVSNTGRVKSLPRTVITNNGFQRRCRGYVLAQSKTHKGYMLVALQRASTSTSISVHRLVAQSFIANPKNLPCVNHKDENKQNNIAENLEWCSYKYNSNYGTRTERYIKNKSRKVVKMSIMGDEICIYDSAVCAAKSIMNKNLRSQAGHIRDVCNGIYETSGGYKWKYYEED